MASKKQTWEKSRRASGGLTPFGYDRISVEDKATRVLKHFDGVAEKYDFMNSLLSMWIHHLWKKKAVHMLGPKPGDRILDICGGTGDLSVLAAKAVAPSGQVVLYDINAKMMRVGREKIRGSRLEDRIVFTLGDAETIAFPDNCFDGAMVGFGIRNLLHLETGFREMYRVLKPGGTFMCLEFSKPTFGPFRMVYDFYSFHIMPFLGALIAGNRQAYLHLTESIRTFPLPDELKRIMEATGLRQVRYERLTNGIAVIHTGIK